MILREPSIEEKRRQNRRVSIAASKKQRTVRDILEDILSEYPELSSKSIAIIRRNMSEIIGDEGEMSETDIQNKVRKQIMAYLG